MSRNSAIGYDAGKRANGVGAAAEADEINAVAVLVEPNERCITVDYGSR